jgi:hypothetical protein
MRRLDVQRGEPGDLDGEVAHQPLELVRPGDEVRLAVDLDEDTHPAAGVDVAADEPFTGLSAGLLGGRREPALAEHRHGGLDVAVGL